MKYIILQPFLVNEKHEALEDSLRASMKHSENGFAISVVKSSHVNFITLIRSQIFIFTTRFSTFTAKLGQNFDGLCIWTGQSEVKAFVNVGDIAHCISGFLSWWFMTDGITFPHSSICDLFSALSRRCPRTQKWNLNLFICSKSGQRMISTSHSF